MAVATATPAAPTIAPRAADGGKREHHEVQDHRVDLPEEKFSSVYGSARAGHCQESRRQAGGARSRLRIQAEWPVQTTLTTNHATALAPMGNAASGHMRMAKKGGFR